MTENMKKEFVSYEQALRLKALGFDEHCFSFYQIKLGESTLTMVNDDSQYRLTGWRTCKNSEIPSDYISTPTFSQAFRWFREKGYIGMVEYPDPTDIYYTYSLNGWGGIPHYPLFDTHEEAETDLLNLLIKKYATDYKIEL